jgi:hypothetical protein
MPILVDGGALCQVCEHVEPWNLLCKDFALLGQHICRRCCHYNGSCEKLRAIQHDVAQDFVDNVWADDIPVEYTPRNVNPQQGTSPRGD